VTKSRASQPLIALLEARPDLEGLQLFMVYGPKGKQKQKFTGVLRRKGIEIDGEILSPSYAALSCIRKSGSARTTVNGWTVWKNADGDRLDDLYQRYVVE
jgi:hypothetical protein